MSGGHSILERSLKGVSHFFEWWGNELRALVPTRLQKLLSGSRPRIVLAALESGFLVLAENGKERGARAAGGDTSVNLTEALKKLTKLGKARGSRDATIRVPIDACYQRVVELPAAARDDFQKILSLDLERATPFRLQDVYMTYLAEGQASRAGKIPVRQIVAKRESLDPLIGDVEAAGFAVKSVDCWREDVASGLPVDFLDTGATTASGPPRLVTLPRSLAAVAILLLVTAAYQATAKVEGALETLQAETTQMRAKATSVRRLIDQSDAAVANLAKLQQIKLKQIPAIEIVEEISRLLPDTVWLTDLRIDGDLVDMSGLAKAGAALPTLFQRSPKFLEAGLTAPLTLDQREDKERFSLRVRIRQPLSRQATSAGNDNAE
jgi:general secretion pathway protein L